MSSLLLLLAGCGDDRCERVDEPLDYSDDASWHCVPGRDDFCADEVLVHEVLPDNTVSDAAELPTATDPPYDCFYVYPTMDLRWRANLDTELDSQGPQRAISAQARWLRQHCRLYVPAYRQVTYGTYFKREKVREACFDAAHDDVEAAWTHYLDTWNEGRPVVLFGHSQGGQLTSRLHRERRDPQVVAAYAIGWPVDADEQCEDPDETGCMVSFKSFLAGDEVPGSGRYAEGEEVACVDPSGRGVLSAVFLVEEDKPDWVTLPVGSLAVYREAFSAECVSGEAPDVGLRVDWLGLDERVNPVDFELGSLNGGNGSHVLDVQFTLVDLAADMDRRAALHEAR